MVIQPLFIRFTLGQTLLRTLWTLVHLPFSTTRCKNFSYYPHYTHERLNLGEIRQPIHGGVKNQTQAAQIQRPVQDTLPHSFHGI